MSWSRVGSVLAGVALLATATIAAAPAAGARIEHQHRDPRTAADRACRHYARTHRFLKADRAVVDARGAVTVTGHVGYEKCGGPDDVSFAWHRATATFVVAPAAVVRRVYDGSNGPAERTIAPRALPSYLRHDRNGRFFRYRPPKSRIVRLVELYHP